ncbi:MAG: DUF2341 domain-containing protein, partial [Candidatus Aenigmarchaeota archaeon]|nr:DUF2341 domain-containing protein [Candidatus Aenigmarchaeota archaeon]
MKKVEKKTSKKSLSAMRLVLISLVSFLLTVYFAPKLVKEEHRLAEFLNINLFGKVYATETTVLLLPDSTDNLAKKMDVDVACSGSPENATTNFFGTEYTSVNVSDSSYFSLTASCGSTDTAGDCIFSKYSFNVTKVNTSAITSITYCIKGYYSNTGYGDATMFGWWRNTTSWYQNLTQNFSMTPDVTYCVARTSNIDSYIQSDGTFQVATQVYAQGIGEGIATTNMFVDIVNVTVTYGIADSTPPTYSLNSTNSTTAGPSVEHRLKWTDNVGLSGYIFQFCNGTWNGTYCLGSTSNWLSGWSYRKSHNITNATGADTNYQINITVINGTGTDSGNTVYINDKTRSDFGDIRFINSTGSLLDYWIENITNGVNATFWVEIDGNLTSTNQTIYIYYGNSSATNISNGTNTFNLFDDFVGSTLDGSKWQVYSTGNSYSVSNSQLQLSYTTFYTWLRVQSISAFDINYAFRMRFYSSDVSDYNKPIFLEWMDSTTGEDGATYFGFYKNDHHNRFWIAYNGTSPMESYDMGAADTNQHIVDIYRANASLAKCYYDNTFEKNLITAVTGGTKIIGMKVGSSSWASYGAYNLFVDWVAVRKYVNPEPSHGSWGSEESNNLWVNDTWQSFVGSPASAWSNVTKVVNSTIGATIAWCVYANDTSNNWNGTSCSNPFSYTTYLRLLVTLSTPSPSTCTASNPCKWTQNNIYSVQASVECLNGPCGNVNGTVRYNASSANPDTAINTTVGATPFYIYTSSNWLSGWSYRKSHVIQNSTGADVNYTINITVINGTGTDIGNVVYINNKARNDFGDIRFTNSTGSLLNYWIETVNNGVNATFWVKIDGNLTSTNQTIYIYYGNSSATNISNGT